jgi:acyl-CoA thioesterase
MTPLAEYFQQDHFAADAGIELVEAADGRAVARMKLEPRHQNAAGVVQGGALFTLADFAFAAAANSRGQLSLGTGASINFLRPARAGVLTAEAREESLSRRLFTGTVRVTDERGELVAIFTGTAFRKDDPVPPPAG